MNANPNSTKNSPHKGFDNGLGHSDRSNQRNNLIIIQINVEGLTRPKCEYLQKLAVDQRATVLSLQETHIPTNGTINNYQIPGFKLACYYNHNKYGLSIYIKSEITKYNLTSGTISAHIATIGVIIDGLYIYNTYKPPNLKWENDAFPKISSPALLTGDFNSHNLT